MINQNIKKFFKALDKFLKTSITLVLVIILLVVGIYKVVVYMDFLENKKLAIEHIENKYDFEFELVDSKIGPSSWPAPRGDEFIFYDSDNKLYFYVESYGKGIRDLYEIATDKEMNFDNLGQILHDERRKELEYENEVK